MNKRHVINRTALLAAVIAALLTLTAVAAVVGNSLLKDTLNANEAGEVAELVDEVHATAGSGDGFAFSVDEIFREDDDFYITYSMTVPKEGSYMVALYTPTLDGRRLEYEVRGWTQGEFFDQLENRVLLLGGSHGTQCTELLTFKVKPSPREGEINSLHFKAVLMKTGYDFRGIADFGGILTPPDYLPLNPDADWLFEQTDADYRAMLRAIREVSGADSFLTIDALCQTGYAEMVDTREIDLDFDVSALDQTIYNDVAEHDFDMDSVHLHVDSFRLTHTGASIRYTISAAKGGDQRLNDYMDTIAHLSFCTPEGDPLGLTLDTGSSGGRMRLPDGRAALSVSVEMSAFIPLKDLTQVVLAPVEYPENEQGEQLPPVYDLANGIPLTPVWSAAAEHVPAPSPADMDEPIC